MRATHRVALLMTILVMWGCGNDDNNGSGPENNMVTIAGKVRDLESGDLAPGVKVRLFGTGYEDAVPTGSDGAYEIKVPRGVRLLLMTDDFNPADDRWIPLINVDVVPVYANGDMLDWPIHCCPWGSDPQRGSTSIWDNYLANCDDTENGDLFEPRSTAEATGIIDAVFIADCFFTFADSISVTADDPAAPIGYHDCTAIDISGVPVATQCNVFRPASWTQTDCSGAIVGFCDNSFSGSSVNLTIKDNSLMRKTEFPATVNMPVAPGTISLLVVGIWEGKAVSFPDIARECVWFP